MSQARRIIEQRRLKNKNLHIKRVRELERFPEYCELKKEENDLTFKATRAKIMGQKEEAQKLFKKALQTHEKIIVFFKQNGYPKDYLENIYTCKKCKDTGFLKNGQMCSCLEELIRQERYDKYDLNKHISQDTFENFNYDLFNTKKIGPFSSRDYARINVEALKNFCKNFTDVKDSFYIYGDVGRGKTYLLNCTANLLIENGIEVIYLTVSNLIDLLHNDFNESNSLKESLKKSPVLMLDDLGTEYKSDYNIGLISHLINDRLLNHVSTLITSNIGINELEKNGYPKRLESRIRGFYKSLICQGEDLRIRNSGGF